MDKNDKPTGEIVTRKEMRARGLWHRATSIIVINEKGHFCLNKRSKAKDYCPSFLDTSFGGIVASNEIKNIDLAAKREAEEEMGLPDLKKIKLNGKSILPKFRFKHQFNDGRTKCFLYVYDLQWSKELEKKGYKIKPQKSEIDKVLWMSQAKIEKMIKEQAEITPDGVEQWQAYVQYINKES